MSVFLSVNLPTVLVKNKESDPTKSSADNLLTFGRLSADALATVYPYRCVGGATVTYLGLIKKVTIFRRILQTVLSFYQTLLVQSSTN